MVRGKLSGSLGKQTDSWKERAITECVSGSDGCTVTGVDGILMAILLMLLAAIFGVMRNAELL